MTFMQDGHEYSQEEKEVPKVSLIASAMREPLYDSCLKSLEGTSVDYEVVFAGNKPPLKPIEHLRYIETANIKPAQCYEVSRREAIGETIIWMADDCEFPNDIVGKAYKYWEEQDNYKLILSLQTSEGGYNTPNSVLFDMTNHTFFGYRKDTPLMAPLALISRKFLEELGGFDRRYLCGQYENQSVIMAYMNGGSVEIFGDKDNYINIDHLKKSIAVGESTNQDEFLKRPFASGYPHDRRMLESYCSVNGKEITITGEFNKYEDKDILTKSQSYKGKWE